MMIIHDNPQYAKGKGCQPTGVLNTAFAEKLWPGLIPTRAVAKPKAPWVVSLARWQADKPIVIVHHFLEVSWGILVSGVMSSQILVPWLTRGLFNNQARTFWRHVAGAIQVSQWPQYQSTAMDRATVASWPRSHIWEAGNQWDRQTPPFSKWQSEPSVRWAPPGSNLRCQPPQHPKIRPQNSAW